jgi:hypothetical protein
MTFRMPTGVSGVRHGLRPHTHLRFGKKVPNFA